MVGLRYYNVFVTFWPSFQSCINFDFDFDFSKHLIEGFSNVSIHQGPKFQSIFFN